MLCPNCGTRTTNEHKFCRGCGMNLEPVSRALATHLSPGGAARAKAERCAARRMRAGLLLGVGIVLLGLLTLSVLTGRGFKLIGVVIALLGLLVALFAVLRPPRSVKSLDEGDAPPELEGAPTTSRLLHERTIEPVPSITERTTELLGVEVNEPKPRA